jgi:hypothetical protein
VQALLDAGYTVADVCAVIDHYGAEARRNPQAQRWHNGVTPYRPENFARALGQCIVRPNADAAPRSEVWTADDLEGAL